MLHTTQGIVLGYIKYRETSIIAKIITEVLGLQAYIIQRVRTKKPQYNIALFQPLTLLDMVVYHKKQRSIHRVVEIQRNTPNNDILIDRRKGAIAVFLAELLVKVIREEEYNKKLFDFLWRTVVRLNEQSTDYEFFYLTFMLQLSHYLGFGISNAQDLYMQLRCSRTCWTINQQALEVLDLLLPNKSHEYVKLDKAVARHVTEAIIKFYQQHID